MPQKDPPKREKAQRAKQVTGELTSEQKALVGMFRLLMRCICVVFLVTLGALLLSGWFAEECATAANASAGAPSSVPRDALVALTNELARLVIAPDQPPRLTRPLLRIIPTLRSGDILTNDESAALGQCLPTAAAPAPAPPPGQAIAQSDCALALAGTVRILAAAAAATPDPGACSALRAADRRDFRERWLAFADRMLFNLLLPLTTAVLGYAFARHRLR